jgi:nickel transport protein
MKRNISTLLFWVFCFVTMTASPCLAHKIRIFAWEEGGKIMTEAKFSGGRPAKNVTIIVNENGSGKQLLTGKTDDNGLFGFALPATTATALDIIVDGGDGHKNIWTHKLSAALAASPPSPPAAADPAVNTKPTAAAPQILPTNIDSKELQAIVARELDKQLAPIRKTLAEQSDAGPTLQDILGGIGYILGLAGIAAYFQARRVKEKS